MAAAAPCFVVGVSAARPCGHGRSSNSARLFTGATRTDLLLLRSPLRRSSAVAFSRRRRSSTPSAKTAAPKHKEICLDDDDGDVEETDMDEDAFEALFSQLEEDLKNENLSNDDIEDEISEEDLAKLEQELEEALGYDENGELSGPSSFDSDNIDNDNESDKEESLPKLTNWQLKRLARALKIGRRKTSIKSLAAELGLDRALVLELLRNPPPNLLLMSASLPDEETQTHPEAKEPIESSLTAYSVPESKPEVKVPVHVLQTRWTMQKRLKKVQVETLERVYLRTKRPTNAMISSIVHVTNLPWKRVVKWFEDKRLEDGVPEHRVPFRRSVYETTYSS